METSLNTYELLTIQEKLSKCGLENGKSYLAPVHWIINRNSNNELFLDTIAVFRNYQIKHEEKFKYFDKHSIVSIIDNSVVIEISPAFKDHINPKVNDELVRHPPYIKIERILSPS